MFSKFCEPSHSRGGPARRSRRRSPGGNPSIQNAECKSQIDGMGMPRPQNPEPRSNPEPQNRYSKRKNPPMSRTRKAIERISRYLSRKALMRAPKK